MGRFYYASIALLGERQFLEVFDASKTVGQTVCQLVEKAQIAGRKARVVRGYCEHAMRKGNVGNGLYRAVEFRQITAVVLRFFLVERSTMHQGATPPGVDHGCGKTLRVVDHPLSLVFDTRAVKGAVELDDGWFVHVDDVDAEFGVGEI